MNKDKQISEEEQRLMKQYGISHEKQSVYFYEGRKYSKLGDAIRYAKDCVTRKN